MESRPPLTSARDRRRGAMSVLVRRARFGPFPYFDAHEPAAGAGIETFAQEAVYLARQILRRRSDAVEWRQVVQVAVIEAVVHFAAQHVFEVAEVRAHAVLVERLERPEGTHRPRVPV